jgi:cytidylate kinase
MKNEIVAIDGPAGSGKSSVARAVAERLGWAFLDTGAMYRALTSEALFRGIAIDDQDAIGELARSVELVTSPLVRVNGRDVEEEIRSEPINIAVSVVAANPQVREAMVERQREMARQQPKGTVVEGRDIATVVFPNATLKVYLTATLAERSRRRGEEGVESVVRRDEADSTREASPLRQADGAVVLDTTSRTIDEVVGEIIRCLKNNTSS